MNDDLISRKAAIDEVKRLHDVAWANWKETRISANTMIDALKDLPSAQPEIIRCKDCAYYLWDCIDMPYGMTKMVCWCDFHYDACNENLAVNPDDYCKWAERREE